jgi:aryl-alcohol dehydrogenase-like predicted oxidoreductase
MTMKRRTLGGTGIQVTEIGVGAWQLGGPLLLDGKHDGHPDLGKDFVIELIRRCGDELGINFIDTAEQYGAGESERRVGEALQGRRDRWIIGTKFGATVGDVQYVNGVPHGKRVGDVTARRIPVSLEASLKRLRTDHIDVYVYHIGPNRDEAEGVARFLDGAKKKGQVRAVGISTNKLEHIQYLHSLGCLDVVQLASNMMDPQEALRMWLAEHNIGGVVRGAFAAGKLSGKYFTKPPALRADDIRGNWFDASKLQTEFPKFAVFEELLSSSRTMPQLALRFLLDQPTTHTIILGAKSFEEYRDASRATELPSLTEQENARISVLRQHIAASA